MMPGSASVLEAVAQAVPTHLFRPVYPLAGIGTAAAWAMSVGEGGRLAATCAGRCLATRPNLYLMSVAERAP